MVQSSEIIKILIIPVFAGLLILPQDANGQVLAGFSAAWNVYRSVMRGGRLIRDLTQGAGTVTKAISTFDGFLESDTEKFIEAGTERATPHEPSDNAIQHQSDSDEISRSAYETSKNSMLKFHTKDDVSSTSKIKPKSIGKSDEIDLLAIAEGEDLVLLATTNPLEFSSLNTFRSSREGTQAKRRHRRSKTMSNAEKRTIVLPDVKEKSELSVCEIFLSHINDKKLLVDEMAVCCAGYDACYSSGCRANQRWCDRKLKSCLLSSCRHGKLNRTAKKSCKSTTKLIHKGTVANSLLEHSDAQELHKCKWKGDRNRRGR